MAFAKIADIYPTSENMVLFVRVCRLWKWKRLEHKEANDLQMVLVDDENQAIQCLMEYCRNSTIISQGMTYKISKFKPVANMEKYKTVPHRSMLILDSNTEFEHVPELYPCLPLYWFAFLDFGLLTTRLNDHTILTDIIGRVIGIYPRTKVRRSGRVSTYCRLEIQDNRDQTATVLLKRQALENFNLEMQNNPIPPVVTAITSTMVKKKKNKIVVISSSNTCIYINPWISETQHLRSSTDAEVPITQKDEMTEISELELQHITLITKAEVNTIGYGRGWYYFACAECGKEMKCLTYNIVESQIYNIHRRCPEHGNREGVPQFNIILNLTDSTGEQEVTLRGKIVDDLFGVTCEDVVNKLGYTDSSKLPPVVTRLFTEPFIWELTFQPGKKITVDALYPCAKEEETDTSRPQPTVTLEQIKQMTATESAIEREREESRWRTKFRF